MTAVESTENPTSPESSRSTAAPPVRSATSTPRPAPQRGRVVSGLGVRYHLSLLLLCSVVVSLSLLLSTRGPEQVIVPVFNSPLPGLCMSKMLFGIDCPGCGLTRCFISVAHGDLRAAWGFNPAGLLFFALVVSQIPLRAWQIWRIRHGRPELEIGRYHWPLFVVVGMMMLQWIVKTGVILFG